MRELRLTIDGMHCDGCVRRVTHILNSTPGVEPRNVTVGAATVGYDPALTTSAAVVRALEVGGYPAREAGHERG
jgi:copper chaperone